MDRKIIKKYQNLFLSFSAVLAVAGISFFIAFNWAEMSNIQKLSFPLGLTVIGTLGWGFLKNEKHRNLSLTAASFFIGSSLAALGQIYQTGADPYSLFFTWGLFLIVFSLVSRYPPIWILLVTCGTIGTLRITSLYFKENIVFLNGFIIMLATLGCCLFWFRKIWAYNNLTLFSTGFITTSMVTTIFNNTLGNVLLISALYLAFVAALIFLGNRYKNNFFLILAVISLTIVISSFIAEHYELNNIGASLLLTALQLIIFTAGSILVYKLYIKNYKESFLIRIIGSFFLIFFRFFLFLLLLFFIVLLLFFLGITNEGFLLIGSIVLIGASLWLPKFLKFKENKVEIVSLLSAIALFLIYLSLLYNISISVLVSVSYLIYGIFYFFFPSKSLDIFLLPEITGGLIALALERFRIGSIWILISNFIFILPLLFLLFFLIFSKIKGDNLRLSRIALGALLTLIILAFLDNSILINIQRNQYFVTGLVLLLSLLSLYFTFEKEIISFAIISSAILVIGYFSWYMLGINLALFIIIYSLYKKYEFLYKAGILFFAIEIGFYYYNLDYALIIKAISMIRSSLILFAGYIFLKRRGESFEE